MGRMKYNVTRNGDREENFRRVREGTARDLEDMLTKHEIALMIRPTGFGKTYTMIRLCELARYKKIIYLYPTNVIKKSIIDDYHDSYMIPVEEGSTKLKRVSGKSGRKFNLTQEEMAEQPDLPYMIFCSYSKMLRDWNDAYKYSDTFNKLSKEKQNKFIMDWESDKDIDKKLKLQKAWLRSRLKDVDLLVIDEAHMVGAEGFMKYWPHIRQMFMGPNKLKESRLHVVGATATPLRTNTDVDIEKEIFYYVYSGKKVSAKIRDFTIVNCWDSGILPRPYYIKGVLSKKGEVARTEEILRENFLSPLTIGKQTKNSSEVKVTNNYSKYKEKEFEKELKAVQSSFEEIKEPAEIIKSGIMAVNSNGFNNGNYMRFIVFYQDTKDMIKWHQEINGAFREALGMDEPSPRYKKLNTLYLVSNKERAAGGGLKTTTIEEISERTDYLERINYNTAEVDIIHCIDMLNMGYHVGMVTGVVINRSTGSEIKYYQQIGRCMSVKSNQTPLIIDFDNADAALFKRAMDSLRREAINRIREFTSECIVSPETKKLNAIYNRVKLSVSMDELPEDLIEYYYFDRNAPIYFIHGISKALKCDEALDSIVERIFNIAARLNYSDENIVDDNYVIGEIRLSQRFKRKTLDKIAKAVDKVRQEKENQVNIA